MIHPTVTRAEAEAEARDALRVTRKLASEPYGAEREEALSRLVRAVQRYERMGGDPHDIAYTEEVAA